MKVTDKSTLANWTLRISNSVNVTTHREKVFTARFTDGIKYGSGVTNGIITHIVKYIKRNKISL